MEQNTNDSDRGPWEDKARRPCALPWVGYGIIWALWFILASMIAHPGVCGLFFLNNSNGKERLILFWNQFEICMVCVRVKSFQCAPASILWIPLPWCWWSCQRISAWRLIHIDGKQAHLQSQWRSDTRPPPVPPRGCVCSRFHFLRNASANRCLLTVVLIQACE